MSPEEFRAEAAARSRAGLERRRESLLVSARPILHTAVAASLAWLAATELLGHSQPFFAPVAAVITLGLSLGQRRRRALEVAFGVAVGILVADLLVFVIGTGTWQVGVVTALAMSAALLLGGGSLLVSQAATSAVLVSTLQPPHDGISLARFLDALTGGAVGLAVATLLLPVDPVHLVRRAVQPLLEQLAAALELAARRRRSPRCGAGRACAGGGAGDRSGQAARGPGGRPRRHPPHASGPAGTGSAWRATRRSWPRSSSR